MTDKKEERRKEKRNKRKTYSFDEVKAHFEIYSRMVLLVYGENWRTELHYYISRDYGRGYPGQIKFYKEIIERAENEFLGEFKDEAFHRMLDEIKKKLSKVIIYA